LAWWRLEDNRPYWFALRRLRRVRAERLCLSAQAKKIEAAPEGKPSFLQFGQFQPVKAIHEFLSFAKGRAAQQDSTRKGRRSLRSEMNQFLFG